MIGTVLVANRGEIARRVFRTCRDLGIGTVAVYSDPDGYEPHVREADVAVRLPGATPAQTYLRGDLIVAAARAAGADAVHPGYGFLSENAGFAREVDKAGLTWLGPPADAIEAMGSKVGSKRLMASAGVPVLPQLDPDRVTEADLPVLVKASAGGGGRGMRVVRSLADLPGALASARTEAALAFGDPTVFCEPYLDRVRHVEVQILADRYGTVWAVGERECSLQRRHQKVVEEAPSPLVQRIPGLRERLYSAARTAADAVGYVGAGTVEFLADDTGRFFFLEMNTRLQVEHPVTECTTGLDLVRLQIAVAEGLRLGGEPTVHNGHSIEVRLYAEDPGSGWQPQSGVLHHLSVPGAAAEFAVPPTYGIRLDSGVADGSVVGVHYDPMLAKVIAWAPDRDGAARRLAAALARARIHGPLTNRDLLVRVLRHPAFLAGDTDTGFLETHDLTAPLVDDGLPVLAAALADAAANRAGAPVLGGLPSGWRNLPSGFQRKRYRGHEVAYRFTRDGIVVEGHDTVRLVEATPTRVVLDVGGLRRSFDVTRYPGLVCVDSPFGALALRPVERFPEPAAAVAAGSLVAPMPGTVTRIAVAVGDAVSEGQPLLWLEAMKMEHVVAAPGAGVVAELPVAPGRQVEIGTVLAVITEDDR